MVKGKTRFPGKGFGELSKWKLSAPTRGKIRPLRPSKPEDEELKVNSYAVSMNRAKELIKENNGSITWDDDALMNYGEYKKGDALYKVWLEDEDSISQRIELIKKYNLAGIASWRRGFEEEIIWDIIKNHLIIL